MAVRILTFTLPTYARLAPGAISTSWIQEGGSALGRLDSVGKILNYLMMRFLYSKHVRCGTRFSVWNI